MDTRLKDIISKENRNALWAFLGAQSFNIVVTMLIAWLMFGVVKPAVWPSEDKAENKTEEVTNKEPLTVDPAQVVLQDMDKTAEEGVDITTTPETTEPVTE